MWTGVTIQGLINFLVISAYFKDAIGMKEENLGMLTEIPSWVVATGLPWLIVADWNVAPEQLAESSGLSGVEAVIIPPKDAVITCSAGKGRVLDFAVASSSMAPMVEVGVEMALETRPHVALSVKISLDMLNDKVLVLSAPPIPDTLKVKKSDHRIEMDIPENPEIVARKRRLPKKGRWKQQDEVHEKLLDMAPGSSNDGEILGAHVGLQEASHFSHDDVFAPTEPAVVQLQTEQKVIDLTWDDAMNMATEWKGQHRSNDGNLEASQISDSIAFKLRPQQSAELGGRSSQASSRRWSSTAPPEIPDGKATLGRPLAGPKARSTGCGC